MDELTHRTNQGKHSNSYLVCGRHINLQGYIGGIMAHVLRSIIKRQEQTIARLRLENQELQLELKSKQFNVKPTLVTVESSKVAEALSKTSVIKFYRNIVRRFA